MQVIKNTHRLEPTATPFYKEDLRQTWGSMGILEPAPCRYPPPITCKKLVTLVAQVELEDPVSDQKEIVR